MKKHILTIATPLFLNIAGHISASDDSGLAAFNDLMKSTMETATKASQIVGKLSNECMPHAQPNNAKIELCNDLLDQLNKVVPECNHLTAELKKYEKSGGIIQAAASKRTAEIKQVVPRLEEVSAKLGTFWRPLRKKKLSYAEQYAYKKALKARKDLVEQFNNDCKRPDLFTSAPQYKIESCNQILDVLNEFEPEVENIVMTLIKSNALTVTEIEQLTPNQKIGLITDRYWPSLKKKE